MKCDELKSLVFSISDMEYVDEPTPQPNFQNPHDHAVYKATEVDEAIAELKAKLESVQASAYADSMDAGMRERRLRRATNRELARWLAQGNGEWGNGECGNRIDEIVRAEVSWWYDTGYEDEFLQKTIWVRKWDDVDWHEPTADYLGLEADK